MDVNLGRDGGFARHAAESILAELRDAPVLETALKSRIRERVSGFSLKHYKAVLDDLVAARKIHGKLKLGKTGKPTKTVESYALGAAPPPPPVLSPREAVLEALKAGAMTGAQLKKQVAATVPGLKVTEYAHALAGLTSNSEIHARFKLSATGKPTKTVESYALGAAPPPAPAPFLAPVLVAWTKVRAQAMQSGVSESALLTALLEALGARAGVEPIAHVASAEARGRVLAGVRRLVKQEGAGALIPIRQLRSVVSLPKVAFDAAIFSLRDDESVILHHHEYVGSLSDAERAELVVDGYGNHYMGVALRGES